MSGTNGVTQITHEELARLIRILGMLDSAHDGEALNAARAAVKWLRAAGTDWQTLLEPPAETGVVSVGVEASSEAIEQREQAAYAQGYSAGFAEASKTAESRVAAALAQTQQAQARFRQASQGATPQHPTMGWTGLGGAYSGLGASAGPRGPASPQAAPGAPGARSGASWTSPGPAGSWQAVAQELLDRHAAGIPGVFRGSREAQFVQDVLARGFRTLTQAQDVWLRDIAARSGMSW